MDWTRFLPRGLSQVAPDPNAAVAIGWGDRDFYLETPNWSDFKLTDALAALLGSDGTLIHFDWQTFPAPGDPYCRRLLLDPHRLSRLEAYIRNSIVLGANGQPIGLPGKSYGVTDGFVEARGRYSLLLTCNDWVRRGLIFAGVRTATWSPFPFGLRWWASPEQL